jgi:hypothetical protein
MEFRQAAVMCGCGTYRETRQMPVNEILVSRTQMIFLVSEMNKVRRRPNITLQFHTNDWPKLLVSTDDYRIKSFSSLSASIE